MGENKNVGSTNISSQETISNMELIDIARKVNTDNELILQALVDRENQNRRYNILKVKSDIDHSMYEAFKNSIICVVSGLVFMSFVQIAAQKLGIPSIVESFQNAAEPNINTTLGCVSNVIEYIQTYAKNIFGPLNAKDFISELGPVGSLSGLLTVFTGKNVLENLKEWNAKNRDLNIMR